MRNAKRLRKDSLASARLISFEDYLRKIRFSRATGYRLRKVGAIEVVNIFGRLYVTPAAIAEFEKRALNGEFSKNLAPARKA